MKVVLIAPPLMDYVGGVLQPIAMDATRECPPYGIYLLASVLRRARHEVVVLDLIAQGSIGLIAFWSEITSCQLIGVGTSSLSWPTARDCINEIRRYRHDVPIVLGGIHATMFDAYVLATTAANFVIRGEGEQSFSELCRCLESGLDIRSVPSLTFKNADGSIVRNPPAPKMTEDELTSFPVPDYSQIPLGIYSGLGIESSRGCPFDCSFCSTSYRRTWRGIQPERFVDRLEQVLPYTVRTRNGIIQIVDDEFSVKPKRAIAICQEINRRGLCPKLVFDCRANDLLDEFFVETIAPYTCQFLVGAECGYNEGLRRVGKGTTIEKLEKAAGVLARYGIAARADFSFILGLPWETKEEVDSTVRFACHLYSMYGVRVLLQWYCQIPGSRLWQESRANEKVHEAQYDDYGFFRNLYLFRTGVQLAPKEVMAVSEMLSPVLALSTLLSPERRRVEYCHPEPMRRFFPAQLLESPDGVGLTRLREVAGLCEEVMNHAPE